MGKYTPSVGKNNLLKDEVKTDLTSIIYKLEKGKYNQAFSKESVMEVVSSLKLDVATLEKSLGTGDEDIEKISATVKTQIKALAKESQQEYINRFESAADELSYSLNFWSAIIEGDTIDDSDEEIAKNRISWSRKKLNARLEELNDIKTQFSANEQRLEKEILQLEKDASEIDNAILKEENERKINDLFRKISALKSKLDVLNTRRSSYSACFNTLDIIFSNATEIVNASDFASEEIGKAKALLNIDKLKNMLTEPEKAMAILKRMQEDIKAIAAQTVALDGKVFNINTNGANVNDEALKYKEMLMRNQQEHKNVQSNTEELDNINITAEPNKKEIK